MSLTYFPVTATLQAVISDSSADVDGAPDLQNISAFVYFEPSVNQVYSAGTLYRLDTVRARTNPDDGVLKNIDNTPVSLVANVGLGLDELTYRVSFDHVQYGGHEGEEEISSFRFVAPTDDTPVDLTEVERLPG